MSGQNKPSLTEKGARSAINRAVEKKISSKIASTAIGKAISSVLGAIGGTVVPLVGNIVGGLIGTTFGGTIAKGAKNVARTIGALPFAIANLASQIATIVSLSLAQALGATFGVLFAALAILVMFTAFVIFIINSGAYVMPHSNVTLGPNSPPISQDCPDGGPSGWPVATDDGQVYYIAQGPFTQWSHSGLEAIDVSYNAPKGTVRPNYTVIATHPGIIISFGIDHDGGLWLDMIGECSNGVAFRTRHVHFDSISANITQGMRVDKGFVLGIVGSTGQATGPHDHYEFRAVRRFDSGRNANSPFRMEPPFIPKPVTRGCVDGSRIHPPCNVRVP